jgi:hypothetical protein
MEFFCAGILQRERIQLRGGWFRPTRHTAHTASPAPPPTAGSAGSANQLINHIKFFSVTHLCVGTKMGKSNCMLHRGCGSGSELILVGWIQFPVIEGKITHKTGKIYEILCFEVVYELFLRAEASSVAWTSFMGA